MGENELVTRIDDYWIRFGNPKQSYSFTGNLSGKYLFFCENRDRLCELAKNEIKNNNFEVAKVSKHANNGDYVLCLYWHDDSRKRELHDKYMRDTDLKYRWWKSNSDTRNGKYSQQYLRNRSYD